MRDTLPIWPVWTQQLPQTLRAADVFSDGPRLLPRDDAIKCAHLEFNTRGCLGWLVFDLDTEPACRRRISTRRTGAAGTGTLATA